MKSRSFQSQGLPVGVNTFCARRADAPGLVFGQLQRGVDDAIALCHGNAMLAHGDRARAVDGPGGRHSPKEIGDHDIGFRARAQHDTSNADRARYYRLILDGGSHIREDGDVVRAGRLACGPVGWVFPSRALLVPHGVRTQGVAREDQNRHTEQGSS